MARSFPPVSGAPRPPEPTDNGVAENLHSNRPVQDCAETAIDDPSGVSQVRRGSFEDPCASVLRGDLQAVAAHLARGVPVTARCDEGFSLIELAAAHGHAGIVELLLAGGAAPAGLHAAAAAGHTAIVEALLRRGAALEARDAAGFTPLLLAVASGHAPVVRALLARGADVSVEIGDTGPLTLARRVGDPRLVGMLRQRQART